MAPCMDMTTFMWSWPCLRRYMPRSLKMWWLQLLEWPKESQLLSPSSAPPTEKEPKPLLKGLWRKNWSHLTETLYHLDLDGKLARKPFKPFITQSRRKFKDDYDRRNFACVRHFNNLMVDPSLQIIMGSSRQTDRYYVPNYGPIY